MLDEDHFFSVEDMVAGLTEYLNKREIPGHDLDFIIVCSGRVPGDPLLEYLATYLGIFDIVCNCDGGELSASFARVLSKPNRRRAVLDLIGGHDGVGSDEKAADDRSPRAVQSAEKLATAVNISVEVKGQTGAPVSKEVPIDLCSLGAERVVDIRIGVRPLARGDLPQVDESRIWLG